MNASNRKTRRIDRAALAATFIAAVFTLGVSSVTLSPASPLITAVDVTLVGEPMAPTAAMPCPDATPGS